MKHETLCGSTGKPVETCNHCITEQIRNFAYAIKIKKPVRPYVDAGIRRRETNGARVYLHAKRVAKHPFICALSKRHKIADGETIGCAVRHINRKEQRIGWVCSTCVEALTRRGTVVTDPARMQGAPRR